MASIFDDLRNKGSGLLGDLNNFLFSDTRTQEQKDASSYGFNEVTEGLQNVYQNESKTAFTPRPVAPAPVNPNAKPPVPMNKGESTFLGAVGEYFNNAQKTWKDKGGFDALMSNPQFGIGLSLLQQASEGKTIGASALKAMVDGGVISDTYAKKIAARSKVLAPITEDQRTEAEAVLKGMNIGGPDFFDKLINFKSNQPALYREALSKIAERAEKIVEASAKTPGGAKVRLNEDIYRKAIDQLTDEGVLNFRSPQFFGTREGTISAVRSKTEKKLAGERQLGGPVTKDKAYLVGEVGPEVFIPKVSGKIVSNDDSKIINLLLEANPHLKSVSPARAEKILRNRFPDYFE